MLLLRKQSKMKSIINILSLSFVIYSCFIGITNVEANRKNYNQLDQGSSNYKSKRNRPYRDKSSKRILIVQASNEKFGLDTNRKFGDIYSIYDLSTISHSYYAKLHGYNYTRLVVDHIKTIGPKLGVSWVKIHVLKSLLQDSIANNLHDWILLTDLDVIFMDMKTSLQKKIQSWNATASIFMPDDPSGNPVNYFTIHNSTKRDFNSNTGAVFLIHLYLYVYIYYLVLWVLFICVLYIVCVVIYKRF